MALKRKTLPVRDRLAIISRKAAEKGVPCEVVAEHADAVWKGILACAVRHDVNFIVMASRKVKVRLVPYYWEAKRKKCFIKLIVQF